MSIASEELLGSAPTDALCVVVDLYVKTDAVEQICNRPWMSRVILFCQTLWRNAKMDFFGYLIKEGMIF